MDEYGSYDDALDDIDRYDAVIAKHGTDLDKVDINAASKRGIVVCIHTTAVRERTTSSAGATTI